MKPKEENGHSLLLYVSKQLATLWVYIFLQKWEYVEKIQIELETECILFPIFEELRLFKSVFDFPE